MTMDGSVGGDVLGGTGDYNRQGTVAGVENVTIAEDEAPTVADRILSALQRLIGILIVAALFLWLAPRFVEEPAQTLRRRPLASLGVGLLGLIGFGVLVFLVIVVAVLVTIVVTLLVSVISPGRSSSLPWWRSRCWRFFSSSPPCSERQPGSAWRWRVSHSAGIRPRAAGGR